MTGKELVYTHDDSPKGKVWRITPYDDGSGLCIEYGALGAKLRTMRIPRSKCLGNDLFAEMQKRVNAKISEGYHVTDVAVAAKAAPAVGGEAEAEGARTGAPVLAYVSFKSMTKKESEAFKQRAANRLKSILGAQVESGGSCVVSPTRQGLKVEARFRGQAKAQAFELPLSVGFTLREGTPLPALCVAALAASLPDNMALSNSQGEVTKPLDLGRAVAPANPEVLEHFGLVNVIALNQTQPLGQWFF